jgi:hypothetical protein
VETIIVLAAFAAVALAAIAAVTALAFKLVDAKNSEADARERAARREGEAGIDAIKVDQANAATNAAADAEKRQEQRGDALEKELADEAHPDGTGLSRLQLVSKAPAAVPDPGAPAGKGGGGKP